MKNLVLLIWPTVRLWPSLLLLLLLSPVLLLLLAHVSVGDSAVLRPDLRTVPDILTREHRCDDEQLRQAVAFTIGESDITVNCIHVNHTHTIV